ncbi:hypothetical protein DRW03_19295 [Corallococcus sp. H22C18031201]|nr:hypothetical protein DRW03_19295 [Corallococcus sp. H22C18031201]
MGVLALVAWASWFGEVVGLRGWAGLEWLLHFPLAAVSGCLLAGVASWVPVLDAPVSRARQGLALVTASAASLGAFVLTRDVAGLLGPRGSGVLLLGDSLWWVWVWARVAGELVFALTLASVGVGGALRWAGAPIRWRTVPLLAVGIAAVPTLSWLSIQLLPALNGRQDFIHAVKMGYPLFWTVLVVNAAVSLGRQPASA